MKTHILNETVYTIRTKVAVITTVTGIENAVNEVSKLENYKGVEVFFNDGNLGATLFVAWGKNIIKLINK